MKKLVITCLVLPLLFSSCNKKLKDDINELDDQVNELKSKNEALQNQVGNVSNAIGSDEPITASTSFVDDNSATRTWTDTYKFKAGNYQSQYMEENSDGTYDVYITRFVDVDWNEGAWVFFNYNPTTGVLTNKKVGHYWDWNLSYNSEVRYEESYGNCSVNIAMSNISVATGDISFSLTATANDTYGTTYAYYVPNNEHGCTTQFSFTGKLKVLPIE